MSIVATASVFGKGMRVISVDEYGEDTVTFKGATIERNRYAVCTVAGRYGGSLSGVVMPLDLVTLSESCDICDALPYGVCDRHAN